MTSSHHEVENKYHLDESTVLPDFVKIPGVKSVSVGEHQLVATYFDTSDLALASAGVTLRRRTGGEDAGWHLKLPMTTGRLEIALPLGRAVKNPPTALRTVVAGVVRDSELAPVVVVRTDRQTRRLLDKRGEVLAEVADDRVEAEVVPAGASGPPRTTWREAEVELVSGTPSLLVWASDLMASVGAKRSVSSSKPAQALGDRWPQPVRPPEPGKKSPAAEVIQLRLLTQVTALRRLDPFVRYDAPEAVHDLRVSVRRLRHALASYRDFLDPQQTEPLREELGWLAALLGGPRDAEVLAQVLRGVLENTPESLVRGPVRVRIETHVAQRYDAARADLLTALDSDRYFALVDRLRSLAEQPSWSEAAQKKAGRALSKALDHDWKRMRARVLRVAEAGGLEASAPDEVHAVRKAAKRVRYAAEALTPLPGKGAARMAAAHERIQTVLGDKHDADEAQSALLDLADRAHAAGEDTFTYGVLHTRLGGRSREFAEEFEEAWEQSLTVRARLRKA